MCWHYNAFFVAGRLAPRSLIGGLLRCARNELCFISSKDWGMGVKAVRRLACVRLPAICCGCYWRKNMKYTKTQLLAFKVRQAVGSMAIEGIQVSKQSEATMLEVAAGRVSGKSVREQLVAKYKQASSAS